MRPASKIKVPLVLAVIFATPLALAYVFYYNSEWHPRSGLQHGELLLPLQPLKAADTLDPTTFHGHWTLLYYNNDRCAASCRELLTSLQNIRLAQGKSMAHVQRVLVLPYQTIGDETREFSSNDLHIITSTRWPLPAGWVYLVDPQGNMVMRYAPGFEARGLLKDLQRLLRHVGAE